MFLYSNETYSDILLNKHQTNTPTWWFVKVRLKFCLFVLLVLPCSSLSHITSNAVYLFYKLQNQTHYNFNNTSSFPLSSSSLPSSTSPSSLSSLSLRLPSLTPSLSSSSLSWTSLLIPVPNNSSQDAQSHHKKDIITFDLSSDFNHTSESTLFRRGREAHRTFMKRIEPHRIAPPPVPKLPPSRTHLLQNKHKRPYLYDFNFSTSKSTPNTLNDSSPIPSSSLISSSLSSIDLGLPDNIANEYIDGVNPPKFPGAKFHMNVFNVHHNDDDTRRTYKEPKKNIKSISHPTLKMKTMYILPGRTQTETNQKFKPILSLDNNNYIPTPIRSAVNDSINSILNHIRSKQKLQEKQQQEMSLKDLNKQPDNSKIHLSPVTHGELDSLSITFPPEQVTPVNVSVSTLNIPPTTVSQKSSSDPHSSMKLDLSLMLKQEFDAKNAELNRTSLFTIDDTALDHFRLVGHVSSSPTTSISSSTSPSISTSSSTLTSSSTSTSMTAQVMPSRSDQEYFFSETQKSRLNPSTVVLKKATKRPAMRPTLKHVVRKIEGKNYHRIKPQRRPNVGSVSSTSVSSITTEETVTTLSHASATTNLRWEPMKEITIINTDSTAATNIQSTPTTESSINEFELAFNNLDLNVDESRHETGTNNTKIDWFATFDTDRRRRVNVGTNDTLGMTTLSSTSTPFRLTTERLAYILIGSCCGLSLLCLIVVAMSVRCRDVCDDYRTCKTTDKLRWQQRRLRHGAFVRQADQAQSFFPYPSSLLRATGVLPRYFRTTVMGDKTKINEQIHSANNDVNTSSNGQCCHCVNCSSTWFFRNVKQGDWCCQRGYLEPPKRNKLPFGAASSVNTFMASKDQEELPEQEHETRPKRLMIQDGDSDSDDDFDQQPEDDEIGDEVATDFSNMFDNHHHMHMHYNSSNHHDQQSPGRNKLKPSQLEPFECSKREQMRHKTDDSQPPEWRKSTRIVEKLHRKHQACKEANIMSNARTKFALPKQVNIRRQQKKSDITKASSSHHRPRYKVQINHEPNIGSFMYPTTGGSFETPVIHHHFDPIVGPMVFTGRYPDLGPPPPTMTASAHLHHLRAAHPGTLHAPNVSVIWNSNDSERLI